MKTSKIEKLPSGSYRARVMIDGKSHSITRATQKEVEREIALLKLRVNVAYSPADCSLTAAIDDYIESRTNTLSPSTIRGYRIIQRNRFKTIMSRKVSDLDERICQRAVNDEAKNVNAKTLRNSWGFIHTVIQNATKRDISVSLPQVIPNERNWLTPDEIKIFIAAVKGQRVEIAALLALHSLRCSEILALTWDQIDLDHKIVNVAGAVVPDEDHKYVAKKENKNSSSRREVPMSEPLYQALAAVPIKSGRVVYLHGNTIYKSVNRVCDAAGLPRVGVHGLRHSFASLCYSLGVPAKITMQIGGWSNPQTLTKIYTHLGKKDIAARSKEITGFFDGLTPDSSNSALTQPSDSNSAPT